MLNSKKLTKQEKKLLQDYISKNSQKGSIELKNIVLSIKPKYVNLIRNGDKIWEFRKQIWSNHKIIDKIYIYETSPVQKIIGYFTTDLILKGSPEDLWSLCNQGSGITKWEFNKYFSERSHGFAIKISNFRLFEKALEPNTQIKNFHAPQNFMYLNKILEEPVLNQEKNNEFIGAYIPEEIKTELIQLAEQEDRDQSYYVRKFIKLGLKNLKTSSHQSPPTLRPPKPLNSHINLGSTTKTELNRSMSSLSHKRQEARKKLIEEIKQGVILEKTNFCNECKKRYSELQCPYCDVKNEEK